MGVSFRLLGPVEAIVDGTPLPMPAGKLPTLLAGLLLRANHIVPVTQLARWLWDEEDPDPDRARATVQEYIRRLRRTIGSDDVIHTADGGYRVDADEDTLDLHRFHTLVARGRSAAEAGQLHAAAERLTAALDLWRGPALSNVHSRALHDDEVTHLTEQRLLAREHLAEALLGIGEHEKAIPELSRLTKENPLRERLWEMLMIALYRDHRQAEALAAYEQIRAALADELGVDPGPPLRQLHQAILTNDPALNSTPRAPRPMTAIGPPRQLPADVNHFTGRADDLARLTGLMKIAGDGRVAIAAIEGTAGVGKTTLAIHFAHQVRDQFPDGQLYVNLRGYGPGEPPSPATTLATLLTGVGVPGDQVPVDPDARAALWRTHTAGRRLLLVLDNAKDTEQVRPLLPGSNSLVLATSRTQLRGLVAREGAQRIALDRLDLADAGALLASLVGLDRARAEPDAARRLANSCARLPLAIRIIGERAGRNPGTRLAEFADELDREQDRLALFDLEDDEDTNLRAVFSRSYRSLDPDAAELFRLLGAQPVLDFTAESAAAVAELPAVAVQAILTRLVTVHLMEQRRPRRYQFHDLMREFAENLAERFDGREKLEQATGRLLDWYLYTVVNADIQLSPQRPRDFIEARPPQVSALDFVGFKDALDWLDNERANLVASVQYAAAHGFDRYATKLPYAMLDYLIKRAPRDDWIAMHELALGAARRLGDLKGEAHALNGLGIALIRSRQEGAAIGYFLETLPMWQRFGDRRGEFVVRTNLTVTHTILGEYSDAVEHGVEALRIARAMNSRPAQLNGLVALARAYTKTPPYDKALTLAKEARQLLEGMGEPIDQSLEALTFRTLGDAHARLGDYAESATNYQLAQQAYGRLDMRYDESLTRIDLGDLYAERGDPEQARHCWHGALAVLIELRHPRADEVLDRLARLSARSDDS